MESLRHSVIIALTFLMVACVNQEEPSLSDQNKTISLVASVDTNNIGSVSKKGIIQTQALGASQFSVSEISRVTLEAVLVSDPTSILNVELVQSEGVYSTELELFAGQQYKFTANAFIDDELTYSGITFQSPVEGSSVDIILSHVDAGTDNAIPQINQIIRNELVEQGTSEEVSFVVTGITGDLLNYELSGDAGAFTPNQGTIQLSELSNTATVVVVYQAPVGNAPVNLDYTLKLTNSNNNSVITDFSINVAPVIVDNAVNVSFNPLIKGVSVQRTGAELTWLLDVESVGAEAYLQYAWTFEANVGSAQFALSDTNPGVMDGYEESVSGTVVLTVTDTSDVGGTTTFQYDLTEGDYPDSVVSKPSTDSDSEETQTITFSPATLPNGSRCENDPFIRNEYLFTPAANCSFGINNPTNTDTVWLSLLSNGAGSTFSAVNNEKFTIFSMDIAEYSSVFNHPQTLQITCVKDGVPTYIAINLDGVITGPDDMFETFQLESECSDIDQFIFSGLMSVDNIVVSSFQ